MRLSTGIARNTLIQIIGKAISIAIGLFSIALMTRYLDREGFGQYTIIITFLSFFSVIADMGLTLVTTQMISDPRAEQNKLLSNLFALRLVSALFFLGLGSAVVFFLSYPAVVKLGVVIAAASFVFTALNQIFVGFYQKNLKMHIDSLAEVSGRIVLLAGIIIVIATKSTLSGILAATVVANAINFLIHYLFSFKYATVKLNFDFQVWRQIIRKSWPLAITIFFNLIYLRTDTLLLSLFKSQSDVGLYGAAYKIIDVLTTIPFMFAGLVLPVLTREWLNKNESSFKNALQKSFDALIILAVPMVVGTEIVAEPVMVLVAGGRFAIAGSILKILIIAVFMIFAGCIFSHAVIAIDRQKKMIKAYFFTAVTSLLAYLILIPSYSYYGAAWATVYSESIIALASIYAVYKYGFYKPKLKILGKTLIASLIMAPATYWLAGKINLILVMLLSALTYSVALFLLKGITKEDLKIIKGPSSNDGQVN